MTGWSARADGLEVVLERVARDVPPDLQAGGGREPPVEAGPDARVGDLLLDVGDRREVLRVVSVVPPFVAPQYVTSIRFVPRTCAITSEVAPVTHPCADGYSGWFGVGRSGVQFGSAVVARFPSMSAFRIAVYGRQCR
jgi:hypothetical protein